MFGRMTLLAALVALAACANVTPAGRNARAGGMEAPPEPPPRVAAGGQRSRATAGAGYAARGRPDDAGASAVSRTRGAARGCAQRRRTGGGSSAATPQQ